MPRIRFTAQPKLPRDLAHLDYQQGTEVDLSDDQADRWIRRGVAEIVDDAAQELPLSGAANDAVVEIPDDWRDQHHMTRLALARRLTQEPVENAEAADKVIADELERRAAE